MYNKRKTLVIAVKRSYALLNELTSKDSGTLTKRDLDEVILRPRNKKVPNFNKLSDAELEDLLIRYQCMINEYNSNSSTSDDDDNINLNLDFDSK